MAEHDTQASQSSEPAAVETSADVSVLSGIVDATGREEKQAKDMLAPLLERLVGGQVTYDRNATRTIESAIEQLDAMMSQQLAAVMHHSELQKLEGTWRGLHHLVFRSNPSQTLKFKALNVTKDELRADFEGASDYMRSALFKKMYTEEFDQAGGVPFGAMIGDYEFNHHSEDVALLRDISGVAAASFCPFISAVGPDMFGLKDWTDISKKSDLEKAVSTVDHAKWQSFRETPDSRFVTLTMPRVLARLPYGSGTKPVKEFRFEEFEVESDGRSRESDHGKFTWMNAAYALGVRMANAFEETGFCTAIRGFEGGGKVEDLPVYNFVSEHNDVRSKCPTEVLIPDTREKELSKLGFIGLLNWKNTDYAAFIGGQTTQRPEESTDPDETASAKLSARLPYIMATSRVAQYLKIIGREKIGSLMQGPDVEKFLKDWLAQYTLVDPNPSAEQKARYPFAEASVQLVERDDDPGAYDAVAYLRPWLFFEELHTSMQLVARIPSGNS